MHTASVSAHCKLPACREEDPSAAPAPSKALGGIRTGVLTNPRSGGNRKNMEHIRGMLSGWPYTCHVECATPRDVSSALGDFLDAGVELIAVNGGDGTMHALLTELFRRAKGRSIPLIAALRGGTTNMTAGDIGISGRPVQALRRLLRWAREGRGRPDIVRRPVLRIRTEGFDEPLYGMFFGTGGIYQGIEFCHRAIYTMGVRGQTAAGLALARFLMAVMMKDEFLVQPERMTVKTETGEAESNEFLMTSVTTLERLFLGLRPFWGTEQAPLHFTGITSNPRRMLLAGPFALYGRPHRSVRPENGYHSHNVHRMELEVANGFAVDGELYGRGRGTSTVLVEQGGTASFLKFRP